MKKSIILLCALIFFCILTISCSNDTGDSDVDVDLSVLSTTMAQAEYENIIINSEKYIGKTIRAAGTYFTITDDTGSYYHYVIIIPGDDCCQLGFEFKRDGNYIVPDDYPENSAAIEVTGILNKGEDRGFPYLYLASAEMTKLS